MYKRAKSNFVQYERVQRDWERRRRQKKRCGEVQERKKNGINDQKIVRDQPLGLSRCQVGDKWLARLLIWESSCWVRCIPDTTTTESCQNWELMEMRISFVPQNQWTEVHKSRTLTILFYDSCIKSIPGKGTRFKRDQWAGWRKHVRSIKGAGQKASETLQYSHGSLLIVRNSICCQKHTSERTCILISIYNDDNIPFLTYHILSELFLFYLVQYQCFPPQKRNIVAAMLFPWLAEPTQLRMHLRWKSLATVSAYIGWWKHNLDRASA